MFGDEGREELPQKTEMETLVAEIEGSSITLENNKKYYEKVASSTKGVMIQIQNLTREYGELNRRVKDVSNRDSFKRMVEDGFIPREVYDLNKSMNKIILEAYNWKTLQAQLLNIMFEKFFHLIDDVKALDIKRDALQEFREMDRERIKAERERNDKQSQLNMDIITNISTMFQQSVLQKFQNYDEKLITLITAINEQAKSDRKDLLIAFSKTLELMDTISFEKKRELKDEISQMADKQTLSTKTVNDLRKPVVNKKAIEEIDDNIDEDDDEDDEPAPQEKKRGPGRPRKNTNDDIRKSFEKKTLDDENLDDIEDVEDGF